jgi:hypothetical protein
MNTAKGSLREKQSKTLSEVLAEREAGSTCGAGILLEHVQETETALQELEQARAFVPHIIANAGVIVDREGGWSASADYLGDTRQAQRALEALQTVVDALEHVAPPVDGESWESLLNGIVYGYADEQRRAAYLLGLAVGQRLGPDAFALKGVRRD